MDDDEADSPDEAAAIDDHDSGGIRDLNEEFYATDPGLHIERRVQLIAAFADAPIVAPAGEFTTAVLEPLDGWELIGQAAVSDEIGRAEAITVESFMLGFHACEVLLRQYLAHLDAADYGSPWYEMADEQRPGKKYNDRVAELRDASTADLARWVHLLFIGHVDAIAEGIGMDRVDSLTDSIVHWIRYAAKHFLEFRNTYNAAKHGLATVPSHARYTVSDEDENGLAVGPASVFLSGATLTTIEYARGPEKGELTWSRVSHVIDPVVHVRVASVMAALISHLRVIGRARHLGSGIRVPTKPYPPVGTTTLPRPNFRRGRFSHVIGHSTVTK